MSTAPNGGRLSFRRRRRTSPGVIRLRRTVAGGTCLVLVATASACGFAEASAMPAVRDFLIAWQVKNYGAAASHTVGADKDAVAKELSGMSSQLDAASIKLGMGRIKKNGDEADAHFSVRVDLGENNEPWTYNGSMHLKQTGGKWKVVWDPSVIHPNLKPGQRLAVVTEEPTRSPIKDSFGATLLRNVPADIVGVFPGQLADAKKTITQFADQARVDNRKMDAERLLSRVLSAPPQTFLPLLTLQRPEQAALADRLREIPGVVVQPTKKAPIAPAWAPELVGELGPATGERLAQVGAPYQPGDTIGVSGLQLLYQRQLAGTPTVKVVAQDPDGQHQELLRPWSGKESRTVSTELTIRQQKRAEGALKGLDVPASLVAVRAGGGQVLAVANRNTNGQDLALEGRYPPGLTFGIISANALMERGTRADTPTDCPATTTVGGKTISNPGGKSRPKSGLQFNFAYSCATTLAELSKTLDGPTLARSAARFGIGLDWGLPVTAYTGSVPVPTNDGDKALTMIGQGKVTVSPLSMALAAGAVVSGTWRPPLLLRDPVVPPTLQASPLDPNAFGGLKTLIQRSVFSGTAKDAKVPGNATVYGVVSTVSYTEKGRQKTVSWFVGSRGDIAFAVAVEGDVPAARIAAKFLDPKYKPPTSTNSASTR